ncbi:unnamed protein product [Linum tenue]|uniref:Pectinesterase n=1 Tax=Linum tenue TaxID=586396 RepID=A0AAV0P8P0_9ROSI|nr:unnamed protein product [Linum tenue]
MSDDDNNSYRKKMTKKMFMMAISSVLLVAMGFVAGVAYSNTNNRSKETDISTTSRVVPAAPAGPVPQIIQDLCNSSLIKDNCMTNIMKYSGNITDPKELVKLAVQLASKSLEIALEDSEPLKATTIDPMAKRGLEICDMKIHTAMNDLNRSVAEIDKFDPATGDKSIDNLKTWLEATLTFQEVCVDAFANTTGPDGHKMREILTLSGMAACNCLAMVDGWTRIMQKTNPTAAAPHRRLLGGGASTGTNDFPGWVTPTQRKLLASAPADIKPDITVAQDGSGQFKTINDAIKSIGANYKVPFVIYIKTGVYNEQVIIRNELVGIMFIGDGPDKTRVTGNKNYRDGFQTQDTPTVAILAPGFIAKDMGFENTAGPEGFQAVAFLTQSDYSVYYNCQFDGYQDTLCPLAYRQFYRDCVISGTIDFIFGVARTVLQNCTIIVRKPMLNQENIITAEGRQDPNGVSAIVIMNSKIVGAPEYLAVKDQIPTYLGRPWKVYSRTVIMHTEIDDIITPSGWAQWEGDAGLTTSYYAEFENTGPGSNQKGRATWPGIKHIQAQEAENFTPAKLYVEGDDWIKATGVPYIAGMS